MTLKKLKDYTLSTDTIVSVISQDMARVNFTINGQLNSNIPLIRNVGDYIINSGGKRIRPQLTLLAARSCQYSGTEHINLATIIEFIHTATLLHDDVVDDSALRRGTITAHKKWSNPCAVLVGDFLYSRAFQLLAKLNEMNIINELSQTTNSIAEGEVMQLLNIGKVSLTEQEYFETISKKTAILFATAMKSAAYLAQSHNPSISQTTIDALWTYGFNIGIAFQIRDDMLDYIGSNKLGKKLGNDLAEGKITLPLIYAYETGTRHQKQLINNIIANKSNQLDVIIEIINDTHAHEKVNLKTTEFCNKAIDALETIEDNIYKNALIELAELSRTRNM